MLTAHSLCWLCQMPLAVARWGICSRCSRALLACPPLCPQCGLPAAASRHPCGRCLQKPPPWHRLVAVNDYRPPLSGLVQRLKFHHRPELGAALARLLLQRLLQRDDLPPVDALVGVPLWHRRRWRRGYNQCDELCRPLARWRGCVWHREGLTRQRAGAVQHSLNARQRRQNLKNAFQLEFAVQGLHIALVDDVVTTGSTVAEISRLLLRNGAATVQVWCLCRTL
ncbi:DNA utilization protein GntX [Klebsiella pneumoniae]|uniref:DNA utilization protein GntX n=1 Tax=Klebsiella pneumoniae TaxID=573 RepID=UPI00044CA8EA|nr:DNA utilization protein GntX [Klebsiella pneumoniae]EWF67914.1 gluconate transporter periplasmic gluconate-binding protein [Klebsiella pneumoniae MGH 39]